MLSQVFIKRGGVPIVSLECVSCKAQSVYEVSKSSYVYLEGTCQNCHNDSKIGVKCSAVLIVGLHLVDFREKGDSQTGQGRKSRSSGKLSEHALPQGCASCILVEISALGGLEAVEHTARHFYISVCLHPLRTSPDLAQAMNDQLFLHKGHFFSPERSVKHFLLPASWCVTCYSGGSSRGCSLCSDSLSPLCSLIIDSTKHHLCNMLNETGLRSGSPIVSAKLYCSQQAKHVPAWHFLAGYLSSPLVITIVHLCY